jgi:hypothetical protein
LKIANATTIKTITSIAINTTNCTSVSVGDYRGG